MELYEGDKSMGESSKYILISLVNLIFDLDVLNLQQEQVGGVDGFETC